MMPTYSERQDLARQFPEAVACMRRCLHAAGMLFDDDDIVYACSDYSDGFCAQWLALPDADKDLLVILTKHLRLPRPVWQVVVENVGDGTGDGFIVLPTDLLAKLGWSIGDALEGITMQNGIVLRRHKG